MLDFQPVGSTGKKLVKRSTIRRCLNHLPLLIVITIAAKPSYGLLLMQKGGQTMSRQNQVPTHTHVLAQSGVAFSLVKGQILRVIDVDGEQVSDLVCFAQEDSRPHL